jgi:hypothetical protein
VRGASGVGPPLIGADAEGLDEPLPTRRQRQGDSELEDLAVVEMPAELLVVLVAHDRVGRREDIDQSKGDDGSCVEVARFEVSKRLLHFVFG